MTYLKKGFGAQKNVKVGGKKWKKKKTLKIKNLLQEE